MNDYSSKNNDGNKTLLPVPRPLWIKLEQIKKINTSDKLKKTTLLLV